MKDYAELVQRLRLLRAIIASDAMLQTDIENDDRWPPNALVIDALDIAGYAIVGMTRQLEEATQAQAGAFVRGRTQGWGDALLAVEDEHLHDSTGEESDLAYTQALNDAARAIKAIPEKLEA